MIHRYRPKFIGANRLPSYLEPSEYVHLCNIKGNLEEDDDHHLHHPITERSCISTPFVTSTDFQSTVIAERLKNFIKEVKLMTLSIFSCVKFSIFYISLTFLLSCCVMQLLLLVSPYCAICGFIRFFLSFFTTDAAAILERCSSD